METRPGANIGANKMSITYSKDGAANTTINGSLALAFWRAFRSELWSNSIKRDPSAGDMLLGVKIISISI